MDIAAIRRWDVGALEQLEQDLTSRIATLASTADDLSQTRQLPGQEGESVEASRKRFDEIIDRLTNEAAASGAVREVTRQTATAVRGLKTVLAGIEDLVHANRMTLNDDGTVTDSDPKAGEPERARTRRELEADAKALILQAQDIDSDAAAILTNAAEGKIDDRGTTDVQAAATTGADQGKLTAPAPPQNATPAQNSAYWNALPEFERQEVLTRHPEWVGNRDGIPADVRHQANVSRIDDERKILEDRRDKLQTDIANHPFGGTFTNEDAELELVNAKLRSLDEIQRTVQENPTDGRLLLMDTTGERVKAAFAIGNPDTADHISVTTPGIDTTVDRSLNSMVNEAKSMGAEARLALVAEQRGNEGVATIAWIGYEPPDKQDGGTGGALDNRIEGYVGAASEDRAKAGAPALAGFYEGLDAASNKPDPHITALGHSYGSLTTSLALQQNTNHAVDDAVFYGSPGLEADDATDLGLRPGHAYLAEADKDAVADLGRYGGDPSSGQFDNLPTHDGVGHDGQPRKGVTGHSEYPRDQTITEYNFAMIVAGLPVVR